MSEGVLVRQAEVLTEGQDEHGHLFKVGDVVEVSAEKVIGGIFYLGRRKSDGRYQPLEDEDFKQTSDNYLAE